MVEMELISTSEFARRVELSNTMINKYIHAGKIGPDAIHENKKHPDKKLIDFLTALQYFAIYNDIADLKYIIDHPDILTKIETYVPPVVEKSPEKSTRKKNKEIRQVGEDQLSILESDRRHSAAKAQLAEINLEKALGNLVSIAEVKKALYNFGASIRLKLEAIPDRAIDNIFSAQDRSEAHFILTNEIKSALQELTNVDSKLERLNEKQIIK